MASSCALACERVCCPSPDSIRSALVPGACVVPDLKNIANLMRACTGVSRLRREALVEEITTCLERRESSGLPLFSQRAAENLRSCDLRPQTRALLGLNQLRRLNLPSAARIILTSSDDEEDEGDTYMGAPAPLVQPTAAVRRTPPPSQHHAGSSRLRPITFGECMARLPFYRMVSDPKTSPATYNQNWLLDFGEELAGGPSRRVLMCFVDGPSTSADDDDDDGYDTNVMLAWPPADTEVFVGSALVHRRGRECYPVDITDDLPASGVAVVGHLRCGRLNQGQRSAHLCVRFVVCELDAASARGDVRQFLQRRSTEGHSPPPFSSSPTLAMDPPPMDGDLELCNERVSLHCPLTLVRPATPARTVNCKHAQCFDMGTLFEMNANAQAPKWQCPICLESAYPHEVVQDALMTDALTSPNLPHDATHILVAGNRSSWTLEQAAKPFDEDVTLLDLCTSPRQNDGPEYISIGSTVRGNDTYDSDLLLSSSPLPLEHENVDPAMAFWLDGAAAPATPLTTGPLVVDFVKVS